MAVSVNKLIYDLERRLNAVDSGRSNDYRIVDLVSFINDAYELVIEHLVQEKDQNETIRNHLRPLLVPDYTFGTIDDSNQYFSKVTYPSNFYEISRIRIKATKDCCDGFKWLIPKKPQGDDLDTARGNPYRRSDYFFEQALIFDSDNGLRIYHEGDFKVESVVIDYYRKIKRVEAPELVEHANQVYRNWDGDLIVNNVDFEIDSTYLARKIVDVAEYLTSDASKDFLSANEKVKKILQINQLHK